MTYAFVVAIIITLGFFCGYGESELPATILAFFVGLFAGYLNVRMHVAIIVVSFIIGYLAAISI